MRVLLIDVNCKYSSTGKIVYSLYKGLRNDGNEASICYGRGPLVEEPDIYKFGLDWETRIHAGLARITGLNGYFSPISTRRLIKYIENFKPDIVHIHELHAYFVNFKPLLEYLKEKKIKVVWTFHCEYMYTGKCGHANECSNFKHGCGHCPEVHEYPKSLFFDFTKKMLADKKKAMQGLDTIIVTPSRWLADRAKESFLKGRDIRVIHNGIDTSVFHYRNFTHLGEKYNLKGKKIVLSVAPNIMDERKGGQFVIKLSEMIDEDNVIFVLVGADKTEKVNKNLLMIQRTKNQEELAQWYSIADCFVICSKRETFSMTCAEALCCGTQVVGFKSGAPETIFIEPYAKFVTYGDLDALKEALFDQGTSRTSVAEYAYKNFSNKSMYINYLKLYQSVLPYKDIINDHKARQ